MKRTPLFVPVLWFFTTGCWITVFCVDFYYKAEGWQVFLHALTALASLAAAVTNLARYKKEKNSEK